MNLVMKEGKLNSLKRAEENNEWERVLWKKQNYPDNYVGEAFFRVSTKCIKISPYEAFYGSLSVTQEVCSCFDLVAIYWGVSEKKIDSYTVLFVTGLLSFCGYLITHIDKIFYSRKGERKKLLSSCLDEFKAALFAVVLCWVSSPIIKTLTASVATDTIHACTIGLLFLHLCLHSYGADVAIVNPTMSHNLGLFAAVCLASRLTNDLDVFAFVLTAIGFFNLLPNFCCHCRDVFGKSAYVVLSVGLFCGSAVSLQLFSPSLFFLFFLVQLFVNGFAPLLFIYLQPYRKNIYGPWDEALVKER